MKKYATHMLSFLLSMTLIFSMYVIYDCYASTEAILVSCLTLITGMVFYGLCLFTERHKVMGGILIAIVLFLVLQIFSYFSRNGYYSYGQSFIEWLLTKGSETEDGSYYLWALFLFFTPFFSITIYYFANTLYRMFFLTLICLIPNVLYQKVLADMNNVFLVLIALLNMAIFIAHRRQSSPERTKYYSANTVISCTAFILLLFLVTAAIPKSAQTPYYSVFEDAFMGGDTTSPLGEEFSELSTFSNDAGGFLGLTAANRKLYEITFTNHDGRTPYLKRQNFDYYNFDKNRWYPDNYYQDARITPMEYEASERSINLPALQSAFLKAEMYQPGFLSLYGMDSIAFSQLPGSILQTMQITSQNFGAIFYLVPPQALSVSVNRKEPYFATGHGAFYSEVTPHSDDFSYSVSYYNDDVWRNVWFQLGGSNLSTETSLKMLSKMQEILLSQNDSLAEVASSFLTLSENAATYQKKCAKNNAEISPKIQKLALSITDGLTYDYEKAQALADYFRLNGYVYDLTYHPLDKSPEYFLFSGKKGSCSDYASAYTLLARSIGLTVRYAEGYVMESGDNYNTYVIKSRDAHAFPEVFLPNVGWVVYEPTVSRLDQLEHHFSLVDLMHNLKMDYGLMSVILVLAILGIILIVLIRLLLPIFFEIGFRTRLHMVSCDTAAVLVYQRIVKKASRYYLQNAQSKTPYELAEALTSIGCDMFSFTYLLEQHLYNNQTLPPNEKSGIISLYRSTSRALFQNRRKEN